MHPPAAAARPRVSRPRPDAAEHIHQRPDKQHCLGKLDDDEQRNGDKKQRAEGVAAGEAEFLALPEAPCAGHEESAYADDSNPDGGDLPGPPRKAAAEMYTSG